MKSKLLILGLGLAGITAQAQVVDISSGGNVAFYISTATDTFYTMYDTLAGVTITGNDSGHVWVDSPGNTVKMQATGVTNNTDITDVILELSENMKLDFDENSTPVGVAEIKGGLKLGYGTEILNTGSDYTHFTASEQYRYVEEVKNRRATIIAPSLLNAERDSLRYWSGTGSPSDGELYSIEFWDNKTVSFVTGHHIDSTNLAIIDSSGSTGSNEFGPNKDFTIYNSSDGSYQHVERENGLEITSEKFMPQMVDNGRAIVVYYGDTSLAYDGTPTRDSIFSFDGFHDGTITLDITNQAPENAFYRHWHMIGNPYRSSLDLSAYLAEPLTGASDGETNGYYGGRTISLLTDVDLDDAGYNAGYAVVNAAGLVVGVNNNHEDTIVGPDLPTVANLAPGQGFFIFHTAPKGQTVTTEFNNSMRSTVDTVLYKKTEFQEPIAFLNIKQSGNVPEALKARKWNQLAVALSDDIDPKQFNAATLKQDLSLNSDRIMSKRDINIYSQNNHSEEWGYAIKSVDLSYINKNIPLGFETKVGGVDYEFELSKQSINLEEYDVFIIDRLLNTTHNISKDGPYVFNVFKQSKQQDRFFMRFGYSEEENFVEEVDLYSNGDIVYVSSNSKNTEIQEFKMYDVSGRMVLDLYPGVFENYEVDIRNYPRGVYFVRVTANNKVYNGKVLNNNN